MHPPHLPYFDQAASQHGLVTRTNLTDLGWTADERRHLVATGGLAPMGSRVFRVGGAPTTPRQRVAAACLETEGVASHQTAAWLHGIPGFDPGRPPDVMVMGRSAHYRGPLARVHTTTWLPSSDRSLAHGVPCLSVARTIFSLAGDPRSTSQRRLRSAVDDAIRMRLASDGWLWWLLERVRRKGRRGVARLEAVLRHRAGMGATESWLEHGMLLLLADGGLPIPVCQRRIERDGSFVARVDLLYEAERIVIEVLGHTFHSSEVQLAADAARRNALQLAGYRVLEFTYDDIVARPAQVLATVRSALAEFRPPSAS